MSGPQNAAPAPGPDLDERVEAALAAPLEERAAAFERLDADLVAELQRLEEV